MAWLSLVIFYGLSGGMSTAQAQARAYVANGCDLTVGVIDTSTNTVIATIPIESVPRDLVVTPDGTRVYVTTLNTNTLTVIDTATNTVIATIPTGFTPIGVAITPDGTRAYATSLSSIIITVIDTATNTVVETLTDGISCPDGIAFTTAPLAPTSKDDCKNGGYKRFGPPAGPFRNQGQCVSYVQSHSGGSR